MAQTQDIKDFLVLDTDTIRQGIRDIDESYNNPWDILAELCQNSIDAIRKENPDQGEIFIEINSQKKIIKIKDNGDGIDPGEMPRLLKPFVTNKRRQDSSIGEKGVGLTFVMFSCDRFVIKSGNKNGCSLGEIIGANSWKNSEGDKTLPLKHTLLNDSFQGTEITMEEVREHSILNLKFPQLKYILRTKTAIGNTKSIWEKDIQVKVHLSFVDQNGQEFNESLPSKYWLIFDELDKNSKIDLDEFIAYSTHADRTDYEKRTRLKDKIIMKKGEIEHRDQRIIRYVSCFLPKRRHWDDLSIESRLCTKENIDDEDWLDEFGYCKFESGIFCSVKGMPTGIKIDHPSTGYAGYWSNMFILFEDSKFKFDIGRKAIHGSQTRIYRKYAKEIFNDYLTYVSKYVSGDIQTETDWNRDDIFAEIESMVNLEIEGVKLLKTPKDQEASVAALFFECIGNGKVKDLLPLCSGYREKYDLYALWGNRKLVMEFKSKLKNIARDFNYAQKMFDEIDCVVCWNVSEDDKEAFRNFGIDLEEVSPSIFAHRETFPNATHRLVLSGIANPLYVIDLKKLLEG
ncbi:MAG: ATP-binding protein [Planctomycetes bacterium]|nr:ATP-binding protein [Planctomycetota bacterium]